MQCLIHALVGLTYNDPERHVIVSLLILASNLQFYLTPQLTAHF